MGVVGGGSLAPVGFTAAMLSPGLPEALLITAAGIPPVALLVAFHARSVRREPGPASRTRPGARPGPPRAPVSRRV